MLIIDWLHKLPEGIKFSNVFLLLLQQLATGVVEELKQASAFCLDFASSSFCHHFILLLFSIITDLLKLM
jgi:hypothetical protein